MTDIMIRQLNVEIRDGCWPHLEGDTVMVPPSVAQLASTLLEEPVGLKRLARILFTLQDKVNGSREANDG